MKFATTLVVLTSFLWHNLSAQTVLAPGDIAIIFIQTDDNPSSTPDDFAFVTFVDVAAGTEIIFTDCGADLTGFNSPCTEGAQKYIAPAGGITSGTVVRLTTDTNFSAYTDSRIIGAFSLSETGDQVIAFQDSNTGNATDAGEEPTFIFAINAASTGFTGSKTSLNETNLPTGLSDIGSPRTALGIGINAQNTGEVDNAVYDGSAGYTFGNEAVMKIALTNPDNYLKKNQTGGSDYINAIAALSTFFLPVELLSFRAKLNEGNINLSWETAAELNNEGFEIQHASAGDLANGKWTTIGAKAGYGDSHQVREYQFVDAQPAKGLNYYRLKQIDYDGTFEYSEVISVLFSSRGLTQLTVAPNPINEGAFNLAVFTPDFTEAELVLFDAVGRVVHKQTINSANTEIVITQLAKGIYTLVVEVNGERIVERVAVQ